MSKNRSEQATQVEASMNKCINFNEFMHYIIHQVPNALLNKPPIDTNAYPKWLLYSGLFVLLKQKLRLTDKQVHEISRAASSAFASMLFGNVRSFV